MKPYVPAERWRTERFPVSEIREGKHFPRLRLRQIRETDEGLKVAFGYELDHSLPDGCTRVLMVDDDVFTYVASQKTVRCMTTGRTWAGLPEPQFLYYYETDTAEPGYYTGGEKRLAYLHPHGTNYAGSRSAYAAVIHHERVFYIGLDYRFSYSPAIKNDNAVNSGKDPQLAGDITVMQGDGKFVEIASYKDRVYAFRERSIFRVRADGEPLNFKADILPMPCGTVRLHTMQVIDDKMVFFTQNGMFTYDGDAFESIADTAFSDIDLSSETGWESARFGFGYFGIVPLKNGEKGFLYYDMKHRRASFLDHPATSVAAGNFVSFAALQKYSYRLTDCGLGFDHPPARFSVLLNNAKRRGLSGVTVRGTGAFSLTVTANGAERTMEGSAEHPVFFVPVRADRIELNFSVSDLTFCMTQLELHWREYDD